MSLDITTRDHYEAGSFDLGCPLCAECECQCVCAECGRAEPVEELRLVDEWAWDARYLCARCIAPCGEHARDPDGDHWRDCPGCRHEGLAEGAWLAYEDRRSR